MKTDNTEIIQATQTLPLETVPYDVSQVACLAIQIKQLTGSATYKLQASCDEGYVAAGGTILNVSIWSDIADSTQVLATGDDLMYDYVNNGYKWIRVVVTGTGTAVARINTKGV